MFLHPQDLKSKMVPGVFKQPRELKWPCLVSLWVALTRSYPQHVLSTVSRIPHIQLSNETYIGYQQ